ncbi:MAG TPA: type II 3-dehydroquinate dehydratase [Chitinophagaceae bacterium]|nr:type II 3-dehydroquinate dehydratase [Chitinophagaceae bacterium]
MRIVIINGPNLNLVGKREPEMYGSQSMDDYIESLIQRYANQEVSYFQSNVEGELVNLIQQHGFQSDGLIINAGAYAHTSIAIADAVKAVPAKVIEVHISNVFAREAYRHHSYLSAVCDGFIAGLGLFGYDLAIQSVIKKLNLPK